MSSNKVNGLCAYAMDRCKPPTVVERKVKGAIFRVDIFDHPTYYCAYQRGMSPVKAMAHVYTRKEIAKYKQNIRWAPKCDGRWILVYEDAPLLLSWQQPPVIVHE